MDFDAQALAEDRAYGPSRASVLRAIRELSRRHAGMPDWNGASVEEIQQLVPFQVRFVRNAADWLEAKGLVTAAWRRGRRRPVRVYRSIL